MNQHAFIKTLREELERNNVQNIADILADYEEHFTHGLNKGKTEKEISHSLGFPATIASAYKTERLISDMKSSDSGFQWAVAVNVICRLLLIAPFNFFVLFIPGVVIFALLVSGWAVSLAIGAVSFALLSVFPSLASLSLGFWAWLCTSSISLALFGGAALLGMTMFLITKYIVLALINYLQWNLKFILQKN